jgi:hypothetical protein
LAGGPSPAAVSQPPPEFLEEMLELRMRIEEAKTDAPARAAFERSLGARQTQLVDEAGSALDSPTSSNGETLTKVRQTLNAAKFIRGLLRDLHEE